MSSHDRLVQEPSSRAILALVADPKEDLAAERRKSTFKSGDLSLVLYESQENINRRHEIMELIKADPRLSKEGLYFLSRSEKYTRGISVLPAIREMVEKHNLSREEGEFVYNMYDAPTAMLMHFAMFLPTILGQGTAEQVEYWGTKAMDCDIIGCYAQSELGHGTYLRGLETTATYDKSTQEFLLHSPTLTALKWWPGTLGKTATHAIVVARLFIDGRDFGPFSFVVQIRDLETHLPLPGVSVGDIGPKMGFAFMDNGYLGFDHCRVPRNAMLMKNAKVTEDGTFIEPKAKKAAYGTMVLIRSQIVAGASLTLAKAVTIAVRFSAVRRQTTTEEGTMEAQIIDYENQQRILFPMISAVFAFFFTGKMMTTMYKTTASAIATGDFAGLPDMHAISSGLKAICTWFTSESVEKCRLLCGGHGYSLFSGLPSLYETYVGACTYEGENNVMCLQTARYLLKAWAEKKSVSGFLSYLSSWTMHSKFIASTACDLSKPEVVISAFAYRAGLMLHHASVAVDRNVKAGMSELTARDAAGSDLIAATRAHCYYVILHTFAAALEPIQPGPVLAVLQRLFELFALSEIELRLGEFMMAGYMTAIQVQFVHDRIKVLLRELRPDAVALVDGFDLDDYALNSALGRYDGDVYKALFDMAQQEPLNKTQVTPGYTEFIRPILKSKL